MIPINTATTPSKWFQSIPLLAKFKDGIMISYACITLWAMENGPRTSLEKKRGIAMKVGTTTIKTV